MISGERAGSIVQVRIHRGASEIGGNCIEVAASDGRRVVLDLGRPLSAGWDDEVPLPPVAGFDRADPSLLGLVISHPHLDHYGLARELPAAVPVYMGREAAAMIEAASFFSPVSGGLHPAGHLRHREAFDLGPFLITPYLNDHSAFDAYSLLVEADGRRIFYTGDLRAHGRKAALFEQLIRDPPRSVEAMLMEGTHVRADATHDEDAFETESQLEDRVIELCRSTTGAVVVFGSAQNLDRVVTVYRAARRARRQFVLDLYGSTVAAATRSTIPQPGFESLRVYVPIRQRVLVKEAKEFWRTAGIKHVRVFPEELAATPGEFLFHVPPSTCRELLHDGALDDHGLAVWSLWDGYLRSAGGRALTASLQERDVPFVHVHTSGHASIRDLRRLVSAINPHRLVPIHSEATGRFRELFPRVEQRPDGQWWAV
jgi:ribonuclease J